MAISLKDASSVYAVSHLTVPLKRAEQLASLYDTKPHWDKLFKFRKEYQILWDRWQERV
jgi:hypothetical protein